MTKNEAIHALVQKAYEEVGYHEGSNNWTKYADNPLITQLYGWNVQNQPWCETFVAWLFITVFGYTDGVAMTYGGNAACGTHAQLYKNNGAWYTSPQKGDQIYFLSMGAINHTGIVADVSGATITTVEGNYSDRVATNTYNVNDPKIAGYGRPNWAVVANEPDPEPDDDSDVVHPQHRRACYHLEYGDGCRGKGYKPQASIRAWQEFLICWGFEKELGADGADGEFGKNTEKATKLWQTKAKGLGADVEVNGVVDTDDWEQIIFVPTE